jgi:L,D-transpeptidase ErfK/SrfK
MDQSRNSPTGTGETRPPAVTEPDRAAERTSANPAAWPPAPGGAVRRPMARSRGPLPRPTRPRLFDCRLTLALLAAAAVLVCLAWAGTGYGYRPYKDKPARVSGAVPAGEREMRQLVTRLDRRTRDLAARLKASAPRGVYIVIDQTQNRLYLKRDDDTLLEARCSAGSGMVLKESGGKKREWVFDSPRGRFQVLSMLRNPVWAKPDWAFIEDGQPIPTSAADRLESGSLGEYALYFGNGFMIHGTLYERLLGRAVSHGCIRVGRDDLRKVWANARLGMHIYIY